MKIGYFAVASCLRKTLAAALSLVLVVVCVVVMGVGDVFTRRRERGAVGAGH